MWQVQKNDEIERFTPEELREELRNGSLSGAELARRDTDDSWKRLYEYAIFAEEVPHAGSPSEVAYHRELKRLGVHFATFGGVMIFLNFPWWGWFWAATLAIQAVAALPNLKAARASSQLASTPVVAHPSTLSDTTDATSSASAAATDDDPVRDAAAKVIELLGQDGHEDLRRELDELTAAGEHLGAQLNLLRTHTDPARLGEIAQRLEELDQRATTVDPSQLDRMRAALEAERTALRDALTTVEELELERQSMLHMLSALHLEIIRNGITKASDAQLSCRISDLRAKTSAHREVDASLARARQARRLG